MSTNIFEIEPITLLQALERVQQPSNFLTDLFFNRTQIVNTETIALEYKREGRILAPAIVKNAKGVTVNRTTSNAKWYSPVTFAPRRVIGLADVSRRLFGEIPNLYNPVKPEERTAKLIAEDLRDLTGMHINRREQLAAELLQTGKLTLKAYADDGELAELDEIDYEFNNIIPPKVAWTNANAKIYDDLRDVSEMIQRQAGIVPTIAICGKNVEKYLLQNKEIQNWLMVPNRQNLAMAEFTPHFTAPEVRFIGRISALNLEFVSYVKTYLDENNQSKPFIDDDTIIIGTPNIGQIVYAPITLFDKNSANGFSTIAAPLVPKYTADEISETLSLTVYSRCLLLPDAVDTWAVIKVV